MAMGAERPRPHPQTALLIRECGRSSASPPIATATRGRSRAGSSARAAKSSSRSTPAPRRSTEQGYASLVTCPTASDLKVVECFVAPAGSGRSSTGRSPTGSASTSARSGCRGVVDPRPPERARRAGSVSSWTPARGSSSPRVAPGSLGLRPQRRARAHPVPPWRMPCPGADWKLTIASRTRTASASVPLARDPCRQRSRVARSPSDRRRGTWRASGRSSSGSRPVEVARWNGRPDDQRGGVTGAGIPGRWAAPPAPAMSRTRARRPPTAIADHVLGKRRCAGDGIRLIRNPELRPSRSPPAARARPVTVAAHDDPTMGAVIQVITPLMKSARHCCARSANSPRRSH